MCSKRDSAYNGSTCQGACPVWTAGTRPTNRG
eukprot:CAMPEP_0172705546 /NCGR_PEP_ID=MMETSP1074-20121228/43949_1 /TAXON_ID=2916 /ORGANISM="Ceratium fusus, Strain PA161109" /LENGTH=31 /DNA_ID= /DNA_START= /DNA_END= /DNA_ORIENTATION=